MTGRELVMRGDPPEVELDVLDDVLFLRAALARSALGISAADREIEQLTQRVHELESLLEEYRRFQEVEHLQLGRMLTAASARRLEGLSRPVVSSWTGLLLMYSAVLGSLAALLWLGVLYG
jgi:hypothetical protein